MLNTIRSEIKPTHTPCHCKRTANRFRRVTFALACRPSKRHNPNRKTSCKACFGVGGQINQQRYRIKKLCQKQSHIKSLNPTRK